MQSNTSALHRGNQLRVTLRTPKQPRLNSSAPEQYPADVASRGLLCLQQPGTHQPWSINRESCLFIARRGFLQLDEERKALLVRPPKAGRRPFRALKADDPVACHEARLARTNGHRTQMAHLCKSPEAAISSR
jgi:hypothetical protein